VDERDVREHRHRPAERIVYLRLARGVGEMVVAADHVGDRHVVVVHHDRVLVGGRAVPAQDDHVVELGVRHAHDALDEVVDDRLAFARRLETDGGRNAGRRLRGIAVAPTSVVAGRPSLGERFLAHGGELFGRAEAEIGVAGGEQRARYLLVAGCAGGLEVRGLVGAEVEPFEPVEDGADRRLGVARLVGVLDPEEVGPAVVAAEEIVEEGGARAADMQHAGRARGEAGADGHGDGF
jgi:hypothetical protein